MDDQDRTGHDPFAPLTVAEVAPSFPEDRLRRAGADEAELAESREAWEAWTPDEQRLALEALGRLTDEELADALAADRRTGEDDLTPEQEAAKAAEHEAMVAEVTAWARGEVAAGRYPDVQAAVLALQEYEAATAESAEPDWTRPEAEGGPSEDERLAEHARLLESGLSDSEARGTVWPEPALVGDGSAGQCLICADLPAETVALLPEHSPAQHAGDAILDREVEPMLGDPAPEQEWSTVEWWNAAGYRVLAQHDPEGQVAVLDPEAQQVATGGPGEAAEAPGTGDADQPGADPSVNPDEVPDGNVETVVAWIGTNPSRAQVALLTEQAGKNRKGVTEHAERVLAGA